ncbi:MAG: sensor histidine kinase [Chloroflexi bacterium]|nr:sensor histidine kinase [Chloroflexota bacterium]
MPLSRLVLDFIHRSLRLKVTLGLVLPLVGILGIFTAIEYARHREVMFNTLSFLASQTSRVIENGIQHEMLSQDTVGLQHMLDSIGEDKTLRIVYLLDTKGRVVFAPEAEGVGQQLDNHDPTCQPCHRLPAEVRPGSVVVTLPDGQRIFRSMNPIKNQLKCQGCHDPNEKLIGLLLTDISMAPLESTLDNDLLANALWWIGTIVTTVLVVNLAISRMVIRRLEDVAQTLAQFGRGQLGLRLPLDSPDEIGQLGAAFNRMGQRIQSEEVENRALSENLRHEAGQRYQLLKRLITVQEEERKRVARDLHDDLGQDLAGLAVNVEVAERLIEEQPRQARAQLQRIRALLAETTNRAYDIILSLRPSALDDLGLVPALRTHAERVLKDVAIQIEFEAQNFSRRLPPEIETALFRTYQEALNNVVRHSGAKRVHLKLATGDRLFEGEIADDGRGFDVHDFQSNGNSARGLGLLGMQERVAQCGGTLKVISQVGTGTQIQISVPIPETHCE